MNVGETEHEIIIEIELPGMTPDQIDVTIAGDTLRLSGHRRRKPADSQRGYHIMERVFGSFQRSIQLPSFVDSSTLNAHFSHGILRVAVRKTDRDDRRVIRVKQG